jgi:hypothetical protein
MAAISVPRRPFSSEPFTGLALPDGIFETSIGAQRINAHFANNDGAGPITNVRIYVESVSDPGIVVEPHTYMLNSMAAGAERLLGWDANFSAASPGTHRISFIAEFGGIHVRIIKKIFVTKISVNPLSKTFTAQFPEGTLEVGFGDFVGPKNTCCGGAGSRSRDQKHYNLLDYIRENSGRHDLDFVFCLKQYLLGNVSLSYKPTPPYSGQFSEFPFQDPFWKIILCVIALLLLIGAAIAEAADGSGELSTTGGPGGSSSPTGDCCGLQPSGGGTSTVAAGLVAGAAAAAVAAALSDAEDPFRRGQANTQPPAGELTLSEHVDAVIRYIEPVALGRPFAVDVSWEYTRQTNVNSYSYNVTETQHNIHVLSKYDIEAPDVVRVYKGEQFVVRARFFDTNGQLMRGGQLFVQCFLTGPNGEFRQFVLQDDGAEQDAKPSDGEYTGTYNFVGDVRRNPATKGVWNYFVIAQDVNAATPDMTPEQAAQIIGGMVLTHQLTIDFSGGTCPFTPDGHVNVVG